MALPVAAIICIVLACWVVIVLILFAVYQILKTRGSCSCDCAPCGKEGGGHCSECCISLADTCNCCNPSVHGCLECMCPAKRKVSCIDILLCQCCASEGEDSCCVKLCCPCCDLDSDCCEFECCTCCTNCDTLVCCCLEIRLVSKSEQVKTSPTTVTYTDNMQQSDNIQKPANPTSQEPKPTHKTHKCVDDLAQIKDTEYHNDTISTARSVSTARSTTKSVSTARSVSQVEFTTNAKGKPRTPRAKKSNLPSETDMKENKSPRQDSEPKEKKEVARSLPPLPARSSGNQSNTKVLTGTASKLPKKRKETGASALVEVPVQHRDVPLHAYVNPGIAIKGAVSDSNIAANQSYSEQFLPVNMGHMNIQMSASDMQIYGNETVTLTQYPDYGATGALEEFVFLGGTASAQSQENLMTSGQRSVSFNSGKPRPLPVAR